MTTIANWIYAHFAWFGVGLLVVNTAFQKMPVAEQADLIDLAGRAIGWFWMGVVSKLTRAQQTELTNEMKSLITEAVKAELAKNEPGGAQN